MPGPPPIYRGEHLVADFDAVSIAVDGQQIRLTRREFELLRYLVENRNRVLSRDRLLERVWGYDRMIETRSVDVHVGRLRGKLGAAGKQIETVVGLGYRFIEPRSRAIDSSSLTVRPILLFAPALVAQRVELDRDRAARALDAVPVLVAAPAAPLRCRVLHGLPSRRRWRQWNSGGSAPGYSGSSRNAYQGDYLGPSRRVAGRKFFVTSLLVKREKSPMNQRLTLTSRTPRRVCIRMRFGPVRGSPST